MIIGSMEGYHMAPVSNNSSAYQLKGIGVIILVILFYPLSSIAQQVNPDLLQKLWPAYWISAAEKPTEGFEVYHFRRDFNLDKVPSKFLVHVSADNRYHLFVNGRYISEGPAKGDLEHWRFETVDLARFLKKGKNVLAAVVWDEGKYRAAALQSYHPGFILQADQPADSVVNTNDKWRVARDTSITAIPINRNDIGHYYTAIGPGIRVNGNKYPWNWESISFPDSLWAGANELRHGVPRQGNPFDIYSGWQLVPRRIPRMDHKEQRIPKIARVTGSIKPGDGFLKGKPDSIPAHSDVTLLLDQGFETTAYPVLVTSSGKGSRIRITYAEALVDSAGHKGNRNVIEGKHIRGYYDVFMPDGGKNRSFTTLWWRTYRYIQLQIHTGDEPLVLNDFFGVYTSYPFLEKASFQSGNASYSNIWSTGWRTVQLCSHETYMDCPYYEQMQYDGDTRIEGLVTSWVSGDTRLLRKAIMLFNDSRLPGGLTQARYPAYNQQIIPPFSLFWVAMIHDYWMYTGNDVFMKKLLTPVRGVMDWFGAHIDSTGMLGPLPRWPFVDWSFKHGGVPAGGRDGHSSILTLQYVYALQLAADMSKAAGRNDEAVHYLSLAKRLKTAVYRTCWDSVRSLLADTPAKQEFSQHANLMAVLDGVFKGDQAHKIMQKTIDDTSLIQTTYYYRFYLFQALKKAGMEDQYFKETKPWRHMISLGLSTFAEQPEPTRSDCHGWSSSPLYEDLSLVTGINPVTPGFKTVSITPHMGPLDSINVHMPVPQGLIRVILSKTVQGVKGKVELPPNVTGTFTWNGKVTNLPAGTTKLSAQ